MNPDTNLFERLQAAQPSARRLSDELKELVAQEQAASGGLVRPNGEPVPKHWSVFAVGEQVVIKDYTFEVVDISEDRILLKPIGLPIVGEGG